MRVSLVDADKEREVRCALMRKVESGGFQNIPDITLRSSPSEALWQLLGNHVC
jgi:hypothetical protein